MKKILKKIEEDEIINQAIKIAQNAEIYLVGGFLRDFYLNKENFDKDIIVSKIDAKKFSQELAQKIDATFISLDEENKIYRLVLKNKINCIDIANMVGNSIQEDLNRRDLTINSIALNLKTLEIIDVTSGIKDLKERKLRHINEQNFIDDPLRLLRVFRFQSMLGFSLDNELLKIIKKHAKKINLPAVERVNYELLKLFSGENSAQALIDMDNLGLLKEILPICEDLKKVPPNSHHHLNLFGHSIEVVKQIQELYEKSNTEVKNHLNLIDFGGATRLSHLKFAGLLHDIGKPSTWTIEEDTGKHRFIKHDDVGAKLGKQILKDKKFSKKQIDYIAKIIKYHIYPSHVVSAPELTEKIYMRFIRKMCDESIDVIIIAMADRLSARGIEITDDVVEKNINNLKNLLNYYLEVKDGLQPLPKLLSGEEIMDVLNLKPSKELGEVIKLLKEAQLSGDITTKQEALQYIQTLNCTIYTK